MHYAYWEINIWWLTGRAHAQKAWVRASSLEMITVKGLWAIVNERAINEWIKERANECIIILFYHARQENWHALELTAFQDIIYKEAIIDAYASIPRHFILHICLPHKSSAYARPSAAVKVLQVQHVKLSLAGFCTHVPLYKNTHLLGLFTMFSVSAAIENKLIIRQNKHRSMFHFCFQVSTRAKRDVYCNCLIVWLM